MPRYIQPIKVGNKRYYAVFSTIVMDFVSPLYPDLESIKRDYPGLRVKRGKPLRGEKRPDGSVAIYMKVWRSQIGGFKRKRGRKRR